MKCPDCGAKISAKHYDPTYEWYECPKCEGAFTVDEMEASRAEQTRNEKGNSRRKASGGRGKKRAHTNGAHKGAQEELAKRGPIAKGKKRRTEIEEDDAALAEFEKAMLEPKVKAEPITKHRDEVESAVVLGAWQDEIQAVYEDLGTHIDEENARDKALIIWREIHMSGVSARNIPVPHATCKEHS